MKTSNIELETTFSIPIWSVKKAREFFDDYIVDMVDNQTIYKIEYKEENFLIFTNFIITVRGTLHKVKFITEGIKDSLISQKIL